MYIPHLYAYESSNEFFKRLSSLKQLLELFENRMFPNSQTIWLIFSYFKSIISDYRAKLLHVQTLCSLRSLNKLREYVRSRIKHIFSLSPTSLHSHINIIKD